MNNLSGIVVQADPGKMGPKECRRYLSVVSTSTKFNNKDSVSSKNNVFNIENLGDPGVGLKQHVAGIPMMAMPIVINEAIAAGASHTARKFAMYSTNWSKLALGGLIERLAAGMAHYAAHGELLYDQLSGGADEDIVAVATADRPIAAVSGGVFVSVEADNDLSGATLSALIAASNGEGSTLFTDHVVIDPSDNSIMAPRVDGADLAMGCWHALNYIARDYLSSGAGECFSYAFTRGVHKVMTVVAHSDEGGYVRDVLRVGRFEVPHGIISLRGDPFNGVPQPSGRLISFRKIMDGIALATAGLVAVSDPLTLLDGKAFSTIFTSTTGTPHEDAGIGVKGTTADSKELTGKIAMDCDVFSKNYVAALGRLFGTTGSGDSAVANGGVAASRHLMTCFRSIANSDNRHMKFKSVAPWFWIEPTGVVYEDKSCTAAGSEGLAHLATPDVDGTMPLFRDVVIHSEQPGATAIYVDWRCARRHGAVVHAMLHEEDGLANIQVMHASTVSWAHIGGSDKPMRDRLVDGDRLDKYLWGRGHSSIPAPSEAIYTGESVGMVVYHSVVRDDMYSNNQLHAPTAAEIKSGTVTINVSKLASLGIGKLANNPKVVLKQRSLAAEALERARQMIAGVPSAMGMMAVVDGDGQKIVSPLPNTVNFDGDDNREPDPSVRGLTSAAGDINPSASQVNTGIRFSTSAVAGTKTAPLMTPTALSRATPKIVEKDDVEEGRPEGT